MDVNEITKKVIGAAIEVHRHLGPGLMESVYEECLCHELVQAGLGHRRQVELPVRYKDLRFDLGFRLDVIVEDAVVLELKTVERTLPVHEAQLLTYLKMLKKRVGLLINFNVPVLKDGIKRLVNGYDPAFPGEVRESGGPAYDATPTRRANAAGRSHPRGLRDSSRRLRVSVVRTPKTRKSSLRLSASVVR